MDKELLYEAPFYFNTNLFMSCQKSDQLKIVVKSESDTITYCKCSFTKEKVIQGIDNFDFNTIKNENLSTERKDQYLYDCEDECPNNGIKLIDFNSFTGCNFNCYHCFTKTHKINSKNIKDTFKVLEKLKNNNLETLCLDGSGEIFLLFDKLLSFLASLSIRDFKQIVFITNASLLNKSRLEKLCALSKKTGVNYLFNLSIDGITKETYEATRIGGNFEKTIENLLLTQRYFPVLITFTLKPTNIKDKDGIIPFFKSLGIGEESILIGRDLFTPDYVQYTKHTC